MIQERVFIQKANILQQLGISLWVEKDTPSILTSWHHTDRYHRTMMVMPACQDDDVAAIHSHHEALKDEAQASSPMTISLDKARPVNDDINSCVIDKALPNPQQHAHHATVHDEADDGLISDDIKYELEGVRVSNWILMADVTQMSQEERSIWTSLKSALSEWANKNRQLFAAHRINYPMNEELQNLPILAQKCLDGFIMRLQMLGEFTHQVAFLNDLPDGVDYFGEMQILPTLMQMNHDVMLKKSLWQKVVAY